MGVGRSSSYDPALAIDDPLRNRRLSARSNGLPEMR